MQKEQQQHQHQQLICHLKLFLMRPVGDISPWPASSLEQLSTRQKEAVAEESVTATNGDVESGGRKK